MPTHKLDGRRFGAIVVLRLLPKRRGKLRIWEYRCDCGRVGQSNTWNLVSGQVQSCGCSTKTQGGMTGAALWTTWENMKRRCYNADAPEYKNYGARGIEICERWLHYPNFHNDMFSSYKKGMTLERINNDGPYSPQNCRWATRYEQTRNQRSNIYVEVNGRRMILKDAARTLGIPPPTLYNRYRSGIRGDDLLSKTSLRWP